MTNAERAERAGAAFLASDYADCNGSDEIDRITDVYDFVCDLLHYADSLGDVDRFVPKEGETNGLYVSRMGRWHYEEELAEEQADAVAEADTHYPGAIRDWAQD